MCALHVIPWSRVEDVQGTDRAADPAPSLEHLPAV